MVIVKRREEKLKATMTNEQKDCMRNTLRNLSV